jgi:hypothetical protein
LLFARENYWHRWHTCLCQIFPGGVPAIFACRQKLFDFQWFYSIHFVGIAKAGKNAGHI